MLESSPPATWEQLEKTAARILVESGFCVERRKAAERGDAMLLAPRKSQRTDN
jgi:hypothetical protein